jgi:dienelactone hydrolase
MLTTSNVPYRDGDVALTGFLALDDARTARRPGVLIIHGGAGLDAHARDRATRFAEQGYVAFAADMFGAVEGRAQILGALQALRSDRPVLSRRLSAGLDVLRAHAACDGRVAAVGYCFGGLAVLEACREGAPLDAGVCVHGSLTTARAAQVPLPPLLVCHGGLDPHGPPEHVAAFCAEMNATQTDWQLVIYGGAQHGFTHTEARGEMPGVAYHAPSDARSSQAIAEFLEAQMRAAHRDGRGMLRA